MTRTVLSANEIRGALADLAGWTLSDDGRSLASAFVFRDFSEAFGFMARVALHAEKIDHHPDWSNVWRKVDVRLSTHSSGGVTSLDIDLAGAMNRIAGR